MKGAELTTMAELIELLQDAQGEQSNTQFCAELDIPNQSTLISLYNGTRKVGLQTGRRIAMYAHRSGNTKLKLATAEFLAGVPLE